MSTYPSAVKYIGTLYKIVQNCISHESALSHHCGVTKFRFVALLDYANMLYYVPNFDLSEENVVSTTPFINENIQSSSCLDSRHYVLFFV